MTVRFLTLLCVALLSTTAARAADTVVEDWTRIPVGTRGIPPGWKGQNWGNPSHDLVVVENDGKRVLSLKSANDSSTIIKDVRGTVKVATTPVLRWRWKAVVLPRGGDSRKKETDDQAVQIYVAWPRFPESLRSRIIGYVWDTTAPVGTIVKSQKTGTVTYVVLRSGPSQLGQWLTESRNVADDFKRIYGEAPEDPGAVSIAIDSNDTGSEAASFVGEILFTSTP